MKGWGSISPTPRGGAKRRHHENTHAGRTKKKGKPERSGKIDIVEAAQRKFLDLAHGNMGNPLYRRGKGSQKEHAAPYRKG